MTQGAEHWKERGRRPWRPRAAAAGACWALAGVMTWRALAGDSDGLAGGRLTMLSLAAAVTLSLSDAIARHVVSPREAFRLGWNAGRRHERLAAKVVTLERRHETPAAR